MNFVLHFLLFCFCVMAGAMAILVASLVYVLVQAIFMGA